MVRRQEKGRESPREGGTSENKRGRRQSER